MGTDLGIPVPNADLSLPPAWQRGAEQKIHYIHGHNCLFITTLSLQPIPKLSVFSESNTENVEWITTILDSVTEMKVLLKIS